MKSKILDKKVTDLFLNLIKRAPDNIKYEDKIELIYKIGLEDVRIFWFTKKEKDSTNPSCVAYEEEPFSPENCNNRYRHPWFLWSVETGPDLEGYTFYIQTPLCQFKVPELSRRELVDVQETIETHLNNFIPNYLTKLLEEAVIHE